MDSVYGFTYRFIDVNDAILNFVGVVLGLAAFYLLRWLWSVTHSRSDPNHAKPIPALSGRCTRCAIPFVGDKERFSE